MSSITFNINGHSYAANLAQLPPDITLNTFIREHAQLTATKYMCLEGGCGACVVVVRGRHPATGQMRTWATNSCLTLLSVCLDWEIVTCEGVGNRRDGYHPIQKRLANLNGTQCGYCTPGFVMNMFGLLESKGGQVTMAEVENSFGGNICRCTGYRPILDAMKSFATDSNIEMPAECLDIEDLTVKPCPRTGQLCTGNCRKVQPSALTYNDGSNWYWPKSLAEVFEAIEKEGNADYMLVAGNTAHGVYRRSADLKNFIDVNVVPELKQHSISAEQIVLGANLSLSEAMDIFMEAAKRPGFEYCKQLWTHFDLIANVPVRNMGTLAGNITIKKVHPEFPSDVYLTFEALDVQLIVQENATNTKRMSLQDYLNQDTRNQVIRAFELKSYPKDSFIFNSYKIMPRAQNAHAYVNAAFLLKMNADGVIESARICFGGIRPDFTHATFVEELLANSNLYEEETVTKIFSQMAVKIEPDEVLPDASSEYRLKLACGLLYKFILSIAPEDKVTPQYHSGGSLLHRSLSSGQQTFETIKEKYPLTQPVTKLEALIQCAGEATYMNDLMPTANSVYCAFAVATRVGANIEQIDPLDVLQTPGVIAFYTAKDIPGNNTFVDTEFGYEHEEIFCSGTVRYYDQPLGVVVALTSDIANRAAAKIKVIYSTGVKTVLPTLKDVLEENDDSESFHFVMKESEYTKKNSATITNDIKGHGIFDIGAQYHFSMEPQTTIVVPFEDRLQVWSATQWMDHTQCVIARMLNMKINYVQLQVRRLGGAYGCKITRGNQVACAAALVAQKLNRPARFVQTIESMMNSNGKRWACRSDYEFTVKPNGKMVTLSNMFYQDAGCTMNESPVAGHSTSGARNCYNFADVQVKIEGQGVLTDAPSSAWCRAPGTVEGIAMSENILEHIAFEANIDPVDARMANITSDHKIAELLPKFCHSTEYRQRRQEIDEFNSQNRWQKRGLGISVMEYPVVYEGQFTATVAIYHGDGTVTISHGGIEMGQGMNTKVAQVAAYTLGIPFELIKIESSDTINGANSMVTGGTVGSESVGFAVRKACKTLNKRLAPIKDSLPKDAPWTQVIATAFARNLNLIESDYYKVGDLETYNVYGLALTEIEMDVLTGNNQVRRVDILEDTGESLSPYIDIGQVEGSFVMMLGYWLTEHFVYDRTTGQLLTNRTWHYKPPGAKDIPIDFRIELLQKSPNSGGLLRSKSTGEPPCCLAVSVVFALQHAIQSARNDAGLPREWVRLGAPTTPETIVLSCGTDVKAFCL